jgi:hypothetical protein
MPAPRAGSPPVYLRSQRYIAEHVSAALERLDAAQVRAAVDILSHAPQIFVYGAGRSGIIGRAFAMRLVQTGLTAYVIGESVTPIVKKGDAVFILSGQGESSSSIQTANIVRREGRSSSSSRRRRRRNWPTRRRSSSPSSSPTTRIGRATPRSGRSSRPRASSSPTG